MRRFYKWLLLIGVITSIIGMAGCSGGSAEPVQPDGVYTYGSKEYYVIELPKGHEVSDYFSLSGRGTVVIDSVDFGQGTSNASGVIYNSSVPQGGWVLYDESCTGKILYMPPYFEESDIGLLSSKLNMNPKTSMSIEEAKQYIPFV